MTIEYAIYRKLYGYNRCTLYHMNTENVSPRIGGKLALRANDLTWLHTNEVSYQHVGPEGWYTSTPSAMTPVYVANSSNCQDLMEKAFRRWKQRVRPQTASLGVTIGSWRESRDTLISRTQKLASLSSGLKRQLVRKSKRKGWHDRARSASSDYLEVVFGWMPLVQDIQNALNTLCREPPARFVRTTARDWKDTTTYHNGAYAYRRNHTFGYRKVTAAGFVKVTNPNVYLLSSLGLLNLPSVAWDLVPWSFVVNMFTNMNDIVNSFTDFIGIDVDKTSMTYTSAMRGVFEEGRNTNPAPPWFPDGYARGDRITRSKNRYVYDFTGYIPSFHWRTPELNLELAAIATALTVQNIRRIASLF